MSTVCTIYQTYYCVTYLIVTPTGDLDASDVAPTPQHRSIYSPSQFMQQRNCGDIVWTLPLKVVNKNGLNTRTLRIRIN